MIPHGLETYLDTRTGADHAWALFWVFGLKLIYVLTIYSVFGMFETNLLPLFFQKMTWKMKHAPIRYNKVYYVTYYLTLNTLFATVLPIGALLFFSLSTVNGLASIRKSVRTSIPMRMSSSRITASSYKSSMRNRSHTGESLWMNYSITIHWHLG